MMPLALPSSTQVWKDGRYESTRSCCGTKTSMWLRSVPFQPSSSFCKGGGGGGRVARSECARGAARGQRARAPRTATKCLQHALACSGYGVSVACSKPWMKLAAYWPLTKGSSPADSMLRPQRGSAQRVREGKGGAFTQSCALERATGPLCASHAPRTTDDVNNGRPERRAGQACVAVRAALTSDLVACFRPERAVKAAARRDWKSRVGAARVRRRMRHPRA
jgi:hypothetical protein